MVYMFTQNPTTIPLPSTTPAFASKGSFRMRVSTFDSHDRCRATYSAYRKPRSMDSCTENVVWLRLIFTTIPSGVFLTPG